MHDAGVHAWEESEVVWRGDSAPVGLGYNWLAAFSHNQYHLSACAALTRCSFRHGE